jgi:hypothetical protein
MAGDPPVVKPVTWFHGGVHVFLMSVTGQFSDPAAS